MHRLVQRVSTMSAAGAAVLLITSLDPGVPKAAAVSSPRLHIEEFTADSNAFDVNSTLVVGPTEVLLVDAQYRVADARRLADKIAATGKHLKAIVLSHPDDDHYYGVATILERFPGTPVYMSATGIDEFTNRELPQFKAMKARIAAMQASGQAAGRTPPPIPDSLITPQPFPSNRLTLDGEEIQVVANQQGDVLKPCNTFLWIPSLRTVIAGDIVFNGVHVWLAASDEASRGRWQESLKRISALRPVAVVAGHKSSVDAPDGPDVVTATSAYLRDFDAARKASPNADALVAAMDQKYPTRAVHGILVYAARKAYAN